MWSLGQLGASETAKIEKESPDDILPSDLVVGWMFGRKRTLMSSTTFLAGMVFQAVFIPRAAGSSKDLDLEILTTLSSCGCCKSVQTTSGK